MKSQPVKLDGNSMSAGSDQFHHVRDTNVWELPGFVLQALGLTDHPHLPVFHVAGYDFVVTKYMVMQVVALVLSLLIFRGLAKRIRDGKPATGLWWNFWETLALFIRDEVVRPSIGIPHHDDHGHEDHGGHGHGEHGHDDHSDGGHGHDAGGHGQVIAAAAYGAPAVEVGHPADKYLPFVLSVLL
jgi:F-type H+-transporting ATPase subunit a